MMLEEDLKSFEAMVGFALFCIAVMFGEFLDIIPDPYGYIKYVIWILSIIITWHAGCTNRVMRINKKVFIYLMPWFLFILIYILVYNDVGVKTINKFNPIPYSTLKKFIFCSISPRFGEYMTGIPYLVLCKYRIWGIVSQTLHIIEEFPEIQRCYLGTEKELATLFPTRNLFQMVILTDI